MRSYRVCVADDCVDEVTILCEGLKLHNYEVVSAFSGEQALAACEEGAVDLLLLDIGLPDIDGHEVCKRLKQNPKTADIPVIFVTAKGSATDVAVGYQLGAVDYIAKPYNLPMVMVSVGMAMRTKYVSSFADRCPELLEDPVYTDQLTGLRNRRFLLERLQEEVEKAHRYNYPLSCLMLDVDDVKGEDEELGAASLDDVLVEIAMAMRSSSRNYDILARYEGPLFAAVLPHAPLKDAVSYAKKIRDEVSSITFCDPSFPTRARLNFGIVSCRNGSAKGAEQVLGEAMRNLLRASTHPNTSIVGRDLNEGTEMTDGA